MPISYYIDPNKLPTSHNCFARVISKRAVGMDELIENICGDDEAWKSQARRFMNRLPDEIGKQLATGNRVLAPSAVFNVSIKGTFTGTKDRFDEKRHRLQVNVTARKKVTAIFHESARTKKVRPPSRAPVIADFNDTLKNNKFRVKTGGAGIIKGSNLRFKESDERQGVFFIMKNGEGPATEIRAHCLKIYYKEIIFDIPATLIEDAFYRLEVRKMSADGRLNVGKFSRTLKAGTD